MNVYWTRYVVTTIVIFAVSIVAMSNISSAAIVELINSEKLPSQLHEGEQVSLTIKIEDYGDAKSITIDTSLVLSGNTPIYDFGTLNPSVPGNRYNSTIILDTSLLPAKEFQVSISGRAPAGEVRTKVSDTDIVISKFSGTTKNFYEVHADKKLADIKSFELIIGTKDNFDKTIEKVIWKELDGLKKEDERLFDSGLTAEAQDIANEMANIKIPNSLSLFGIVNVESDLLLDTIVVLVFIVAFIIGYIVARRSDDNLEN